MTADDRDAAAVKAAGESAAALVTQLRGYGVAAAAEPWFRRAVMAAMLDVVIATQHAYEEPRR